MAVTSDGLPLLGLLPDGREIGFPGDSHLFTVARSGAGKNRCVIFPNLILHPGSIIDLDPKGESAKFTARWRNEGPLKQPVYVYDPFHIVPDRDLPASGRASFNPIEFILRSVDPFSAAMMIGEALLIPSGGKDDHWVAAAQLVMAGTLWFVATSPVLDREQYVKTLGPRRRSMRTVWGIIANKRYSDLQLDMVESDNPTISEQGTILSGLEIVQTPDGAKFAPVLNGKENASKLSTLKTQCIGTFASEPIMDTLEGPSVDFGDLQRQPSTVYICLPGKLASVHNRFMRLLIRAALSDIEDAGLVYPTPDGSRRPSTLFLLDEFATLGRFPVIVEAMGRMRGYGLKFWSFVQNLSQLKESYGEAWTAIPGNAGVLQYFGGTLDGFTAEYVSKRTGEKTASKRGSSSSTAPASGVSTNESVYGRPVLFPGQIGSLPEGDQILMFLGLDGPVKAKMMYYDRIDHFSGYRHYMASPARQRPVYQPPRPEPPQAASDVPPRQPGPVSAAATPPEKTNFLSLVRQTKAP